MDSLRDDAYAFEGYIYELLKSNSNFRNVQKDVRIKKSSYCADIITEINDKDSWTKAIVEIKYFSSLTIDRATSIIARFSEMHKNLPGTRLILILPGKLNGRVVSMFQDNNIEIWDIDVLSVVFHNELAQRTHPVFQALLLQKAKPIVTADEDKFIMSLNKCIPGKDDWSKYQKLVKEIFSHLFCPLLSNPLTESQDYVKANRRDIIFPNYCEDGFWAFLREKYCADYVVIEAKNRNKKIGKNDVLQVANYLKHYGTGLFGMIVSRKGAGPSAIHKIREAWIIEKKLIISLQDEDIEQMLLNSKIGNTPESVIRQKIEDFRLTL
jgi:hypothetical protein